MCKEYINLQTNEKLDWNILNKLPDNSMLKAKPELWVEWDFEENIKENIDIWATSRGQHKKVNWICKKCNSKYTTMPSNRVSHNSGCSYCAGKLINHTNCLSTTHSQLLIDWNYKLNSVSPHEISHGSHIKIWWTCDKCNSDYDCLITNRIQGKNCPYCSGRRVNLTNCLETTFPNLMSLWDFSKNTIKPTDVTKGSRNKVWWICNTCNSSFQMNIQTKVKYPSACIYCSGKKVNETNSLQTKHPKIASEWHPTKNGTLTPNDVTSYNTKKVWWLGTCGHEWVDKVESRVGKNIKCPICAKKRVLIGYNDMWTTNPELAKLLVNPEDGYKYMQCSGKKTYFKCTKCNNTIQKKISEVKTSGLSCPKCSDSISIGEKIVYQLLKLNKIDFIHDSKTNFSRDRRYDFILEKYKIIIEVHGLQHYKLTGFHKLTGKSFEDEIQNDLLKKTLALENGYKYIEINASKSDFTSIKNDIVSSILIDLIQIDVTTFDKIDLNYSTVIECWNMFDKGMSKREIARQLKIARNTVARYIKLKEQTSIK